MTTNSKQTVLYLTLASAFALGSLHTQAQIGNTEYGEDALISVTTGDFNSAFGYGSLLFNSSGSYNTATGYFSLVSNTTGGGNTATGSSSLALNTTGSNNTASGSSSLYSNSMGFSNTANGTVSLYSNTTGFNNTASGWQSLYFNTTGNSNTAHGFNTLSYNTTGNNNTANGGNALYSNTTGINNTASGSGALYLNTIGNFNTASGYFSLNKNTTGGYNTAIGNSALLNNTTGGGNMAVGNGALYFNSTGNFNMGIGEIAGFSNATGSNNIFIGRSAGFSETGSNKLYISSLPGVPLIYGEFSSTAANNKLGIATTTVAAGEAIKVWNGASLTVGGVWTNASSRELKDNIETLSTEDANRTLAALSPVRYVYTNSPDEEYVGFIAEDVPDLVASNDRKSLSPMDIVAVLTTVTKDQIAKKDAEIAALKAELRAQRVQQESIIQKQDERMLQMELALAELLRNQSSENQVGLAY